MKHRVVTMHASDRYLAEGTLEDLRREEDSVGYAKRLRHGVIGRGLNDYDAIFSDLSGVGFDGWISIEDGVDGVESCGKAWRFSRLKSLSTGRRRTRFILNVNRCCERSHSQRKAANSHEEAARKATRLRGVLRRINGTQSSKCDFSAEPNEPCQRGI